MAEVDERLATRCVCPCSDSACPSVAALPRRRRFRTDQASDVKKVEKLSNWFFAQTTSKRPRMETDSDGGASAEEAAPAKGIAASPSRAARTSKRRNKG